MTVDKEGKELDIKQISFEKCRHLFKEVLAVRQYAEDIEEEEDDDNVEIEFNPDNPVPIFLDGIFNNVSYITFAADHKVIYVSCNKCVIYYSEKEALNDIKKLVLDIWECFPKNTETSEKAARVGLIKFSNGEYYTSFSDIRKTTVDIEENYNDDFQPVHKDIINFLNQRESGLIMLYGKFGSGKTNYIRHLCSNIPKDYVIVPNSVASRLGDPDFISYITACKDYVFILEDCEQLLVDREENPWNNAITTILNMADGLLSDIVNIKFICTFNADIDKIDPALLRKGRCFAKYEFGDLCEEKVAKLDAKYELCLPEIKPMTLAEVYNAEKRDYSEDTKKPRKIGF